MLFDMGQVNRGKKIVNAGIVTLILLLFGDFIINLTSLGINEKLIKKIVINGIVFINILLFYKGNRIAFKVTMFLLSIVYLFVLVLLPVYLILGLLHTLKVLDIFDGALYLVISVLIIIAVNILVFKTGFYDDVLVFKNYYQEIYIKQGFKKKK
ncbi:hypothetical protein ELD05_11900 [Caldicellulosiruptor changbaiensis]|uniref:Uncharacterized protein n=1 Tax=Caldicellulosiruptor changbaiensis TaxID=1222016 RepID=A0A3T0D9G5_9FIRM|nr:hypothetical protein [Caldicellulosiruptor changbaiensis]AZT91703.1 hypothetical protein ELD05_11900 [Caldicellulosiruptor changbaiensis]